MSSRTRVQDSTSSECNKQIEQDIRERLEYYAAHPHEIDARLKELDEEWDIERWLETNSSVISLFGLIMGMTVNRRWLLLPLAVQSFFLQHALQGWCPPIPLFRRWGMRTVDEIDYERYGLKILRGDFDTVAEREARQRKNAVVQELMSAVTH